MPLNECARLNRLPPRQSEAATYLAGVQAQPSFAAPSLTAERKFTAEGAEDTEPIEAGTSSFVIRASSFLILVVATPPDSGLVAPLRRAIEPLIHSPEPVQSARVWDTGVVNAAPLARERARPRPFTNALCAA